MARAIGLALLLSVLITLVLPAARIGHAQAAGTTTAGQQLAAMRAVLRPVVPVMEPCVNGMRSVQSMAVDLASGRSDTDHIQVVVSLALKNCERAVRVMERFGTTQGAIRAALPAALRRNDTVVDLLFQTGRMLDNAVDMLGLLRHYLANTAIDVSAIYVHIASVLDASSHIDKDLIRLCKEWGVPVGAHVSLVTLESGP